MTNSLRKQFKQKKAKDTENSFASFCAKNSFEWKKIDDGKNKEFLKEVNGKCPDYWCKKEGKEIFVEIKTLTNLTNQKREDLTNKEIEKIYNGGGTNSITSEIFDPTDELVGPFTTFLKDASKKFKNLKIELKQPRILFIDGVSGNMRFTANAIFLGAYDSYKKIGNKWIYAGLQKERIGLFDKTGSNVSAVIYYDRKKKCFFGISNHNAIIPFSKEKFETFFGETKL